MGYDYYTQENMTDKKLSDLRGNKHFLDDAVTFLKSRRKGYEDDDFTGMSGEDIVYDVLEHFRIMNTNEATMSKDYYFMTDETTPQEELQAYARLMYAFDNAKGEGWLDGGGAKIRDYAEGIATAPSTFVSAAAIPFTAGAGAAAVQAGKEGAKAGLKKLGKDVIKKTLLASALDGSVAAASQLGTELIKKKGGETIDEDYDVSGANIAMAAGLGGITGGVASYIPLRNMQKGAERMSDVLRQGELAREEELAVAANRAVKSLTDKLSTKEGEKIVKFSKSKLMAAIDPALVKEGREAKIDILSADLPDGLIGGFDKGLMQRLSAASADLATEIAKRDKTFTAEPGQRITEFLAKQMDEGKQVTPMFDEIAKRYGLTRRQLSAVYAAEVSDAARLLQQQKQWMTMSGRTLTGTEAKEKAGEYAAKLDKLWDEGLSPLNSQDAAELATAASNMTMHGKIYRSARDFEDFRRAMMTSQPATTLRNNIFGMAMTGIDAMDQIFAGTIKAVRGSADASTTFKGTLDTMAYLTKDAYVADTLVKLLAKDSPEMVSRVFMDAAQAESQTMRNTKLAKLGNFANTLNTFSDHVFKKAVVASTINRELRKKGTSLMEVMKQGKLADQEVVSDEMIHDALNEALRFTFQNRFGGKNASDTSKAVNKGIGFIHKNFLTTVIPFPRYLASQAKFIKDYSVLNVAYKGFNLTDEEWAKQATGAGMLAGFYMIQKENANKGLAWFEDETVTEEVINAQAAMGPTAPMHYMMAQFARMGEGLPNDFQEPDRLSKNLTKLLIGTEFRPGGTIVDEVLMTAQSIADGDLNMQPAMKVFGDYMGSVMYPAAVMKDFYGQFDPRSSYLPDTLDATIAMHDLYGDASTNISLYQRMARNLPDINLNEMSDTLREATGIDLGTTDMEGLFKYMGGVARTQFQLEDPLNVDEGYDVVRYDVFGAGPIRVLDPLQKQYTGFTKSPPKTLLQREMTKLNIDPFLVYNPYREKNNALEYLTQMALQGELAIAAENYITSDPIYTGETDLKRKAGFLEGFIRGKINDTRAVARETLEDWANKTTEYQGDYQAYIRGEYKKLTGQSQADSQAWWDTLGSHQVGLQDQTLEEARESIKNSDHYTEEEKVFMDHELLRRYIEGGKTYRKLRSDPTQFTQ